MDLTAEITFAVLSDMKHAMNRSRIVLWVNSISTELAFQAMGLGVRGILRKTLPAELQVKCLQKVQAGELWFEKALTDSFLCARRVALTAAVRSLRTSVLTFTVLDEPVLVARVGVVTQVPYQSTCSGSVTTR